jgi:succinate dehydrogenase / fumarate reductase flavoprotein subunit
MAVAQGALNRRESRGAHFREDFPERRDAFNYHTLVSMKQFAKVEFSKRDVDMSIFEEGGKHYEKFGVIERKY